MRGQQYIWTEEETDKGQRHRHRGRETHRMWISYPSIPLSIHPSTHPPTDLSKISTSTILSLCHITSHRIFLVGSHLHAFVQPADKFPEFYPCSALYAGYWSLNRNGHLWSVHSGPCPVHGYEMTLSPDTFPFGPWEKSLACPSFDT